MATKEGNKEKVLLLWRRMDGGGLSIELLLLAYVALVRNKSRERESGNETFRQGEHFSLSLSLLIFSISFSYKGPGVRQSRENGTLMEADTQTLLVW